MLAAISRLIRPGAGAAKGQNKLLPHVVETVGGGIAEAKNFEKLLTPALESVTDYFARQIEAIPGPFHVSEQTFAQDAKLSTLFPESAEILRALGRSLEVKESLPNLARSGHQHVHAMLGVRRKADGETEIFADHTLRSLAPQEADTRAYLGFVAVKRLLNDYAEHTTKLRRRERLLAHEWNIRNEVVEQPAAGTRSDDYVYATEELAPDNLLAGLIAWLEAPAKYFRLESGGVFLPPHGHPGPAAGHTELPLLHCSDRRQWLVSIVRFPVAEGLQALAQENHTHRHIFI